MTAVTIQNDFDHLVGWSLNKKQKCPLMTICKWQKRGVIIKNKLSPQEMKAILKKYILGEGVFTENY